MKNYKIEHDPKFKIGQEVLIGVVEFSLQDYSNKKPKPITEKATVISICREPHDPQYIYGLLIQDSCYPEMRYHKNRFENDVWETIK